MIQLGIFIRKRNLARVAPSVEVNPGRLDSHTHTADNLHEHGTSLPSASVSGDVSILVRVAGASSPTHVRVVASEALISVMAAKLTK